MFLLRPAADIRQNVMASGLTLLSFYGIYMLHVLQNYLRLPLVAKKHEGSKKKSSSHAKHNQKELRLTLHSPFTLSASSMLPSVRGGLLLKLVRRGCLQFSCKGLCTRTRTSACTYYVWWCCSVSDGPISFLWIPPLLEPFGGLLEPETNISVVNRVTG